jgi:hypothetical protein
MATIFFFLILIISLKKKNSNGGLATPLGHMGWPMPFLGVAEAPPWPLGVVRPPQKAKMGVAETTPIWLRGGRATPKSTSLEVA